MLWEAKKETSLPYKRALFPLPARSEIVGLLADTVLQLTCPGSGHAFVLVQHPRRRSGPAALSWCC